MGIVQAGLEELAKDLKVKIDIQVDDWNNIITKIESGRDRKKEDPRIGHSDYPTEK